MLFRVFTVLFAIESFFSALCKVSMCIYHVEAIKLTYFLVFITFLYIMVSCCCAVSKFDWQDPLQFEMQLSDEECMLRDQFKSYCQEKLMPRILLANRDEGLSTQIKCQMLNAGMPGWYTVQLCQLQ